MADRNGSDALAWMQARWRWIVVVVLVFFVAWRFSGKRPEEIGRFTLVKDDVPCQIHRDEDDARRWCYIVLDTRTGKLEERVRKVGPTKRK